MGRRARVARVDAPARRGGIARFFRLIRTLLVLSVILYVVLLLAARTAGFRGLVADRLETRLGLPVRIEKSRCNARLDLTLEGVATDGPLGQSEPAVRAQRVKFVWSWPGLLAGRGPALRALELDQASIVFGVGRNDAWEPAPLAPLAKFLAKWLELDLDRHGGGGGKGSADAEPAVETNKVETSTKPGGLDRIALRLRSGAISWWAGPDRELAGVQGIELDSTPIELPNRRMIHRFLRVADVVNRQGPSMRNLVLEVMETGDQKLILHFTVDRLAPERSAREESAGP